MRLLIIAIFCAQILMAQSRKATLIYVGDPMCSWCYGFTPEIENICKKFESQIEIQMIMGGLNTKQNLPLNAEMKASLKEHWEEIALSTGQPFKFNILEKKGFIYNTEPACRAVVTVREIDSTKAFAMFKALQSAFYSDNVDITQMDELANVAQILGIKKEDFISKYIQEDLKTKTKEDISRAERNGIDGFPALILLHGAKVIVISNGYEKADKIEKSLKKHLKL